VNLVHIVHIVQITRGPVLTKRGALLFWESGGVGAGGRGGDQGVTRYVTAMARWSEPMSGLVTTRSTTK
jgi:hypothetical protein